MVNVVEPSSRVRPVLTRAHTAAVRLLVALDMPPRPRSPQKDTRHIYKLQASQHLPVLNLRFTLAYYLFSTSNNLRFHHWAKRHCRHLSYAQRLGGLLGFLCLIVPHTQWYLLLAACLLAIPSPCCSCMMLSLDMLLLLTQQYEFWFFSAANVLTWTTLACLYRDARIVFLVVCFVGVELWVVLDANFRTFVGSISSCALAIPLLIVFTMLLELRLVDIPVDNYIHLKIAKLEVDVVDIFTNCMLTLVLFLLRKTYNKRKLLRAHHATTRLVRCLLFRPTLLIQPLASHSHSNSISTTDHTSHKTTAAQEPLETGRKRYKSRVVLKQLGITAGHQQRLESQVRSGRAVNPRQQLTLVSLRLSTIDVRKTLWPPKWTWVGAWTPHRELHTNHLIVLYLVGAIGLLCSAGSIFLPNPSSSDRAFSTTSSSSLILVATLVPICGFLCTVVFCAVFACTYQRDLAFALLRNFAFLFPALQFAVACICLADAMQWDVRCYGIAASALWFLWLLLLDALPPPARKRFRVHKQFVVPVIATVWVGIWSVLYAILCDSRMLSDRVLYSYDFGDRTFTGGSKAMLLNRIITIMVWTGRLTWLILRASSDELVLLRGSVDYYCPFETFTGILRRASTKSILPGKRDSDGSVILIGSTEVSASRRASLQRGLPRRISTQPLLPAVMPVVPGDGHVRIQVAPTGSFILQRTLTSLMLETDLARHDRETPAARERAGSSAPTVAEIPFRAQDTDAVVVPFHPGFP